MIECEGYIVHEFVFRNGTELHIAKTSFLYANIPLQRLFYIYYAGGRYKIGTVKTISLQFCESYRPFQARPNKYQNCLRLVIDINDQSH